MDILIFNWVAIFIALIVSVLLSILTFKVRKRIQENKVYKSELEIINERKEDIEDLSSRVFKNNQGLYEKLQFYLSKKGVNFIAGRNVDPVEWEAIKLIAAILFASVGFMFKGFWTCIIGFCLGFKIPNVIINMSNRYDNKIMLNDIRMMFQTLKLKTESGLFLTDTLYRCYKVVRSARLKKALIEMLSEIKAKNDIELSLSNFEMKFDNKYVLNFAATIRQSFKTGDSIKTIENISKQLVAVQTSYDIELKAKLEAKVQFVQVLVLIEIMLITAYSLIKLFSISIGTFL